MPEQVNLDQSFSDALESLTLWFKERDLPYSIIGGVAVAFLVNPRSTQDIDSIVWLDLDQAGEFLESGARFGLPTPEDIVIMKAIAAREIDYQDNRRILAVYRNVDIKRIKYWVGQFAEVLEMPEILENLEKLLGSARAPRAD